MVETRELADLIAQSAKEDGIHETAQPGVALYRLSETTVPLHAVYEPSVCIVAQGRKQVVAGNGIYVYDTENYLAVSAGLPIVSQVLEASPEQPFLALMLHLDAAAVGEVMLEAGVTPPRRAEPQSAVAVSRVEANLIDASVRLLKALRSPSDRTVLAPLAEKELVYHLLNGEQGDRIRQFAHAESRFQDLNRAIHWIRTHFRDALRVEALAERARMSKSVLHEHFKSVTGLSPLQFQKQLRLREARRLMLAEALGAAEAGHAVGYDSPSQFSREYKRLFGTPPSQDIAQLQGERRSGGAWVAAQAGAASIDARSQVPE